MAQTDDHPDSNTRQGQHQRQELVPHQSTVSSGQNAGKSPAAKNIDTHDFPSCSTWLSAETLDMHCTVDDHRRQCCRHLKKNPAHQIVLVALDLTAAFDNVNHQQLLDCVFNANIPASIPRWLNNYVQNRKETMFIFGKKNLKAER